MRTGKTLPSKACRRAGLTADGKLCYYGKKESDDPESCDLTLWVALGPPRVDGSNYTRLSDVGLDEDAMFRELAKEPPGKVTEQQEVFVREFLLTVTSADLKKKQLGNQ